MKFSFKNITLVSTEAYDLNMVLKLENDSSNNKFITPWTKTEHENALKNKDIFHGIIYFNDSPAGFLILAGLENKNQSLEFMRIIIAKKRMGIGRKTLKAVKSLCFENFAANRLWLDVKTFNIAAKNLYTSEGFIEEGTLRECIKSEDGFESLHILSILKKEYEKENL